MLDIKEIQENIYVTDRTIIYCEYLYTMVYLVGKPNRYNVMVERLAKV